MSITEILKNNRPELSQGSLRTYTSIIKNLGLQMNIDLSNPKNVCKNYKEIMNHLKDVSPKLRKTRLSSLIVFCKGEDENVINKFRDLMMSDGEKTDKEYTEQKMTDKQKDNMIPYDEVLSMYNKLEKEVSPLMKLDKLEKAQFQRVQLYVLLSCLLLISPRRSLDYTEFKIRNIDKEKDNYMTLIKRKPYFVFNIYKTAKKYKTQQVDIPKKLKSIIDRWTVLNPSDYLLLNTRMNDKINPTQLSNMLHNFFGKPISTTMLRHIYLTNIYKDMPALTEIQERAQDMGHDAMTALKYVKK